MIRSVTAAAPARRTHRVALQVVRGIALAVVSLSSLLVANYAIGGLSVADLRDGDIYFPWQPHWALLGVLGAIAAIGVMLSRWQRVVSVLRPLGVAAICAAVAWGAANAAAAVDRPGNPLKVCRTLA